MNDKTQSGWESLVPYITLSCEITLNSCPWLKHFSCLNSLMTLTAADKSVASRTCHSVLQRLLQQKLPLKTELSIRLSVCNYFMLVTLYKIGKVHFRLQLAQIVSMQRQRTKYLLLRARVVLRTSQMKISCHLLADYGRVRTGQICHHFHDTSTCSEFFHQISARLTKL